MPWWVGNSNHCSVLITKEVSYHSLYSRFYILLYILLSALWFVSSVTVFVLSFQWMLNVEQHKLHSGASPSLSERVNRSNTEWHRALVGACRREENDLILTFSVFKQLEKWVELWMKCMICAIMTPGFDTNVHSTQTVLSAVVTDSQCDRRQETGGGTYAPWSSAVAGRAVAAPTGHRQASDRPSGTTQVDKRITAWIAARRAVQYLHWRALLLSVISSTVGTDGLLKHRTTEFLPILPRNDFNVRSKTVASIVSLF